MAYTVQKKTKAWDVMLERAAKLRQKPYLDVGFPKDGKLAPASREGSGHKPFSDMEECAKIMAVHEFGRKDGDPRYPARPFMRPAYMFNKIRIEKYQQRLGTSILIGNISVKDGINRMGDYMVRLIREEIKALDEPALQPATIARKNSDELLIDTKQAYNSVQFVRKNVKD